MASTNISKAYASSGTRTKWTWSFWLKRGTITNGDQVVSTCHLDNNNQDVVRFGASDDKLDWWSYQAGSYSNGGRLQTNRVFRDCNGWYHIVLRWDSSNSTAGDRMKMWINGVEETSFATDTNPTSGRESLFNFGNNSQTWKIGSGNNTQYFDGSLSHIHFCDNQLYQASDFGSFDSTTGEWKINTTPSVSYGTNGFFILKNGNSLTDESPNSNNWSSGNGTLTKTEDCPSNIFCTLNPINTRYISIIQGNNTASGGNNGSDYSYIGSTLAANSGKFYWEVKAADLAEIDQVGVARASSNFSNVSTGHGLQGTPYGGKSVQFSNGNKAGDDAQSAYMGGFSTDDIMMIALDLDNNKITFGRNGQWANGSGGADQTYANSTAAFTNLTAGEYYMPAHAMRGYGGNTGISRYNFGNGYFATTAISSAGTNASNIGLFEYDVPSGFTALSTKGLNE